MGRLTLTPARKDHGPRRNRSEEEHSAGPSGRGRAHLPARGAGPGSRQKPGCVYQQPVFDAGAEAAQTGVDGSGPQGCREVRTAPRAAGPQAPPAGRLRRAGQAEPELTESGGDPGPAPFPETRRHSRDRNRRRRHAVSPKHARARGSKAPPSTQTDGHGLGANYVNRAADEASCPEC